LTRTGNCRHPGLGIGNRQRRGRGAADSPAIGDDVPIKGPPVRERARSAQPHGEGRRCAGKHIVGGRQVRRNDRAGYDGYRRHTAGYRAVGVGNNDLVAAAVRQLRGGNRQCRGGHSGKFPALFSGEVPLYQRYPKVGVPLATTENRGGRIDRESRAGRRRRYDKGRDLGRIVERQDLRRAERLPKIATSATPPLKMRLPPGE